MREERKWSLFHYQKGNNTGNPNNPMRRNDLLYHEEAPRERCCITPTPPAAIHSRAQRNKAYLQNGRTLEHAQQIAAHRSPRTTKLSDRTEHGMSIDEVE